MGERITYFCDICGEDIPGFDPNLRCTDDHYISFGNGDLHEFDACNSCLEKVIQLIKRLKGEY